MHARFSVASVITLCASGVRVNMIERCAFISVIFMLMVCTGACGNAAERMGSSGRIATLDSLIELANEQSSQDDGKEYWWRVFGVLDKISDDKLIACVSKKRDPAATYRYLLEIRESGSIGKVHWETSDDFTDCIDRVLVGIEMPIPPKSPFYFYLSDI